MTLRVSLRTAADVAEARRLSQFVTEKELVPAQEIPASTGLFSLLPGTPWLGQCVANWGGHELRCLVEVPGDAVRLRSEGAWTGDVYGCLRPVDLRGGAPTWSSFDSRRQAAWASPGGIGAEDAVFLARIDFSDARPSALLAVPKGLWAFLVRRADEGAETVALLVETMEFCPRHPRKARQGVEHG